MNVAETLIIVPQANELEPILATFAAAGYRPRSLLLGRLECHLFDELRMLFAVGGHGKTQHAVQTQHLIEQRATVQAVICTGAAGSLGGEVTLRDGGGRGSTVRPDSQACFLRPALPRDRAHASAV